MTSESTWSKTYRPNAILPDAITDGALCRYTDDAAYETAEGPTPGFMRAKDATSVKRRTAVNRLSKPGQEVESHGDCQQRHAHDQRREEIEDLSAAQPQVAHRCSIPPVPRVSRVGVKTGRWRHPLGCQHRHRGRDRYRLGVPGLAHLHAGMRTAATTCRDRGRRWRHPRNAQAAG